MKRTYQPSIISRKRKFGFRKKNKIKISKKFLNIKKKY